MALLDLSRVRAKAGQTITAALWNLFIATVRTWANGNIDGNNIAAGGVPNNCLANKFHTISNETLIAPPGVTVALPFSAHWWAVGAVNHLDLGDYFHGAYLYGHTRYISPCAFTLERTWTKTNNDIPTGTVQLYRNGVALPTTIMNCSQAGTTNAALALAITANDVLEWRCTNVLLATALPIVVGFSGKAEHRS